MAASIEGAFRIIDRASKPLKDISKQALETDTALKNMGKTQDQMGSTKGTAGLKQNQKAIKDLGTETEKTASKATVSMETLKKRIADATRKGTSDAERLKLALKEVEGNYKIRIDDSQVVEATLLTRNLKRELDKVQRQQAQNLMSGLGISGVSGGAQGAQSMLDKLIDFPTQMIGRWGVMIGLLTAAIPVIESVVGALGALAASLSSAIVGGGILGVGGVTGFVAGLATIGPVAVSVAGGIGEAKKALDEYNDAVKEYGRNSAQAAQAQKQFEGYGRAGDIALGFERLQDSYRKRTKPARGAMMGAIEGSLERVNNKIMPRFAEWSNRVSKAFKPAADAITGAFGSKSFKASMDVVVGMVKHITPMVSKTFANMARLFANITAAAKPWVLRFFRGINDFFANAAKGTSNIEKTRKAMQPFFKDLGEWWRLLKETGKLIGAVVGAGRGPGRSLVADLTEQIVDWREAIEADPGKVRKWFDDMIDRFKDFTKAFGGMLDAFVRLGKILGPILEALAEIVDALNSIKLPEGLPGPAGGFSALDALTYYGLYRGGKAAFGKLSGKTGSTAGKTGGKVGGKLGELLGGAKGAFGKLGGKAGGIGSLLGRIGGKAAIPLAVASELYFADSAGLATPKGDDALAMALEEQIEFAKRKFGNKWYLNDKAASAVLGGKALTPQARQLGQGFAVSTGDTIKNVDDEGMQLMLSQFINQQRGAFGSPKLGSGKAGKRAMLAQATSALAASNQQLRGSFKGITNLMRGMDKQAGKLENAWMQLRKQMEKENRLMVQNTHNAFKAIMRDLRELRTATAGGKLGAPGAPVGVQGPRRAFGGASGMVPGKGMHDHVQVGNVMAAPGEALIANQHTQTRIDRMLRAHGTSLRHEIWSEGRAHNVPAGNKRANGPILPGRARGGTVGNLSSMQRRAQQLDSMGMPYVWGGGHGGFSARPSGLDCSGAVSDVLHAGGLLNAPMVSGSLASWGQPGPGRDFTVYANAGHTFMKIGNRFFGTSATNPGGGPGWIPPSAMSASYLASFQQRHMDVGGKGKGGKKPRTRGIIQGGPTWNPNEAATLAFQAGATPAEARLLSTKIIGESSGRANARGNDPGGTTGLGLWQITTGFNDDVIGKFGGAAGMMDPYNNARAAIAILRRQGIGAWYAPSNPPGNILPGYQPVAGGKGKKRGYGGNIAWGGWNARGGTFNVDRPTLFGAGEAGTEEVKITPKSKGMSARRGGVTVHIGKVENHREGDIARMLERELDRLARDIDEVGNEDEAMLR